MCLKNTQSAISEQVAHLKVEFPHYSCNWTSFSCDVLLLRHKALQWGLAETTRPFINELIAVKEKLLNKYWTHSSSHFSFSGVMNCWCCNKHSKFQIKQINPQTKDRLIGCIWTRRQALIYSVTSQCDLDPSHVARLCSIWLHSYGAVMCQRSLTELIFPSLIPPASDDGQ